MTTWIDINDEDVPRDGRLYRVKAEEVDRGFAWWAPEQGGYAWVAEGVVLDTESITHWAEFDCGPPLNPTGDRR
ncbi:MAG: hypothetical protein WDN25_13115 [Acetobacteraceae bacterium]